MKKADPKFLSLIEFYTNPPSKLAVSVKLSGVFNVPDALKSSDEGNVGLFGYTINLLGADFTDGKFAPRQLTEKQLKQQEESKKKGSKKATKVEEEEKKTPEEEEQERRQKAAWDALSKEQQEHRTFQNPFKSPSIRFAQKEREKTVSMEGAAHINKFQKQVEDGKLRVLLTRKPAVSDDQIAKLKKGKPKNLNLAQLGPIQFETFIDLSPLRNPGERKVADRCRFDLIEEGLAPDVPRFNFSKTYVLLQLSLDIPLYPLVQESNIKLQDVLPKRTPGPLKRESTSTLIHKFQSQVYVALKTISNEYSNMFAKENQEKKIYVYSNLKVVDTNKKKDQFLADFVHSGKYKLLVDRLREPVQKLILDKHDKECLMSGYDENQYNRLLSEVQLFLNDSFSQTVQYVLQNRADEINDDIKFSHQHYTLLKNKALQTLTSESEDEKLVRISFEHETINEVERAETCLQNLVLSHPNSEKYLYNYTSFCLRHKMFDKAEALLDRAAKLLEDNQIAIGPEHNLLVACLLLRRGRYKEAMATLKASAQSSDPYSESIYSSALSKQQHEKTREKSEDRQKEKDRERERQSGSNHQLINLQLQQFILQKLGFAKEAEKLRKEIEEQYKRRIGLVNPKHTKPQRNPFQMPNFIKTVNQIKEEAKKGVKLNHEQADQLRAIMVQFFVDHNLFDLVEQALDKFKDETAVRCLMWRTQIQNFKGNYEEALRSLNVLLEKFPKNYDVIILKADICFNADKLYESEQIFLRALKMKAPQNKVFSVYLRLGNVYLSRKSWLDAKNIFLKATELKANSSLSWLGLGIAYRNLSQFDKSEEALNQANIHDCFNARVLKQIQQLREQQQALSEQ